MDYNDSLWVKALEYELGRELMMGDYSISFGSDELNVSNSSVLKSHRMIKRLDMHKGTPPEQLKTTAERVADATIKMVEDTLGWPAVVNTYDQFEITVSIKGKKNASNQSGGTLGKKNASNQSGGTLGEDDLELVDLDIPDDGLSYFM